MQQLLKMNLAKTEITGLFGYPVEHSLSPKMHNQAFEELDLNYIYLPCSVNPDNVEEAVAGIRGLNLAGVNVTIPHKQAVIPYLDELSTEAELIGAVNTIENQDGKLIGHNTDGRGFIRSLKEETDFVATNQQALIIGAGGASRAIAFQLALEGVEEIFITDLEVDKANQLAGDIKDNLDLEVTGIKEEKIATIIDNIDLLVDATPVGMHPKTDVNPVVDKELLHSGLIVYDVVYNPLETVLLKAAKEAGAQIVSGLGMLLYQGVIAFEIWTNKQAPSEVMREALEEGLFKTE